MTNSTEDAPLVAPTKRSSRRRPSAPIATDEHEQPSVSPEPGAVVSPAPTDLAPSAGFKAEVPIPPPVLKPAPAAAPSFPPQPPPQPPLADELPGSPFKRHDVVQILDRNSRLYGAFFIIGDVLRGRAHGYFLSEGLKKEFVTVEVAHCWYVGSSKVRSQVSCSAKWISDNRPS